MSTASTSLKGLLALSISPVTLWAPGAFAAAPDDGLVLPFTPVPSASVAGPTLQESVHQRRAQPNHLPAEAPNVLMVIVPPS